MPNLLEVKKTKKGSRFKLVQIGESGSGKTHRMLTASQFGPMYIFDVDGKIENYAQSGLLTDEQLGAVEFDLYSNTSQIVTKLKQFLAMKDKVPYATVCLDTFSRWNEMVVKELWDKNGGKMNIPSWSEVKLINTQFLKDLFSLPCNIIINAHLGEKENALGESYFTAGGAGASSQMLPEFVDECHYLFIKKPDNTHMVQGKGSGKLTVVKSLLKDQLEGLNFKSSDLSIFEKFAYVKKLDTK